MRLISAWSPHRLPISSVGTGLVPFEGRLIIMEEILSVEFLATSDSVQAVEEVEFQRWEQLGPSLFLFSSVSVLASSKS